MKYLIEIHHGIGDIVQMMGVVESIRRIDSEAHIALILNKDAYKTLFENDIRIQKFYRIDLVEMSKKELIKTVLDVRREKFDFYLISPISNKRASQLLAIMVGAKKSFGCQLLELSEISKKYVYVQERPVHIVEKNADVFLATGLSETADVPKLICKDVLSVEIPSESIAICIGTSIPHKNWPLENYLRLADLYTQKGYQIILLGGKNEAKRYSLSGLSDDRLYNLMGELSLTESATVASKCELVIGGDTGVMHMAAAVGATTLTLFTCSDPKLHCPYSSRSYFISTKKECRYCWDRNGTVDCNDYKCVNEIGFEEVNKLVEDILLGITNKKNYFEI